MGRKIAKIALFVAFVCLLVSSSGFAAADYIYVANSGQGTNGNVSEYTTSGISVHKPLISTGLQWPDAAVANSSGDIFVADNNANQVNEYSPSGSFLKTIATVQYPDSLAFDPSGNLYIGSESFGVYEYSTSGNLSLPLFGTGSYHPTALAIDSYGDLYIGSTGTSAIYFIQGEDSPYGGVNLNHIAVGGMAVDQNGHLFFGNLLNNEIEEYTWGGYIVSNDLFSVTDPSGIALDSQGHLYVASNANGTIGEYTAAGSPISPNLITGLNYPAGIFIVAPEPGYLAMALGSLLFLSRRRCCP